MAINPGYFDVNFTGIITVTKKPFPAMSRKAPDGLEGAVISNAMFTTQFPNGKNSTYKNGDDLGDGLWNCCSHSSPG